MANKRISDLNSATTLTLNDLLVIVNEAQTRKMTLGNFLNYLETLQQFATLDENGKVPLAQLPPSLLGSVKYKASWDANTNSPTIPAAATENNGWYYVVGTAGTTNVDGISSWAVGDWIISNGTTWQKIDNTDSINSWNGRTGTVVPQAGDYTTNLVTEGTNKYYTATRVLSEILSGLSTSDTPITSADSILSALGKAQGQINNRATLDGSGKVPTSQLPASVLGALSYQGQWDAASSLGTANSANKGYYYVVNANGTYNLNGINEWKIGDWAISSGTAWQKIDNTDAISSWNGRMGAVVPQSGDYSTTQVSEGTNKYYTAARVLAEVLAGLSTATTTGITASDTVLSAFGKAQGQINNRESLSNKGIANGYAGLGSDLRVNPANTMRGHNTLGMNFNTIITSTTSELLAYSFQIPSGYFDAGDQMNVDVWMGTNTAVANKVIKLYLNTSASLTGATQIASYTTAANFGSAKFSREISFITSTSMKAGCSPSVSSLNGETTTIPDNSATTIPNVTSGFYLIVSMQKTNASDALKIDRVTVNGLLNP